MSPPPLLPGVRVGRVSSAPPHLVSLSRAPPLTLKGVCYTLGNVSSFPAAEAVQGLWSFILHTCPLHSNLCPPKQLPPRLAVP